MVIGFRVFRGSVGAFGGLGLGGFGLVLDFFHRFDFDAGVQVRLFVAEEGAGRLGGPAGELFVFVGEFGFAVDAQHLGVGGHETDESAAGLLGEVLGFDESARTGDVVEVGLGSGRDDDEFGAGVVIEVELFCVLQQLDGLFGLAAAALGVGDQRDVVIRTGDAAVGAQFTDGFVVVLHVVRGDAECFADDGDTTGAGHGGLGVFVGAFRVEVEQPACGDEVLGNHVGVLFVEGTQL